MIALRKNSSVLRFGDVICEDGGEGLLILRRHWQGGSVLCLFNLGSRPLPLPAGIDHGFTKLFGGNDETDGSHLKTLPALEFWIGATRA